MNAPEQIPVLLPQPRRVHWEPEKTGPAASTEPRIAIDPADDLPAQGYRLSIAPDGVTIVAADEAGAYYGRQTLRQIKRQSPDPLPCGRIEDWPDFPSRGVMLDISRDKVPTMATMRALIDQLAEWKINHLELYTEHTFAYRNHGIVWAHASPMTADEIRALDAYCRERFVELVPNQNSFGHFERWLQHDAYRHLAADDNARRCLDPHSAAALRLLEELYDELLPNFTSDKFNVGCDETWDIEGRGYLEFLLAIQARVAQRGRRMHFWGDIVLQHPQWVPELPRDVTVLAWGYEAAHPFDEQGEMFARSGLPFYVCPGTSAWNSLVGRTDNCVANLQNAAIHGRQHGAIGYLNTDWGDNGHWQYLPVSFLGFAHGAAASWCAEANNGSRAALTAALDQHVFHDAAGVMGRLVHDLGNVSNDLDAAVGGPNASTLFHLFGAERSHPAFGLLKADEVQDARQRVDAVVADLDRADMKRPDAELVTSEIRNAARMLRHGCDRCLGLDPAALHEQRAAIIDEHQRLWLARNRTGGLADSVTKMQRADRDLSAAD